MPSAAVVALVLARLVAASPAGDAAEPASARIEITVLVTARGEPVQGLDVDDFEVRVDGQWRPVLDLAGPTERPSRQHLLIHVDDLTDLLPSQRRRLVERLPPLINHRLRHGDRVSVTSTLGLANGQPGALVLRSRDAGEISSALGVLGAARPPRMDPELAAARAFGGFQSIVAALGNGAEETVLLYVGEGFEAASPPAGRAAIAGILAAKPGSISTESYSPTVQYLVAFPALPGSTAGGDPIGNLATLASQRRVRVFPLIPPTAVEALQPLHKLARETGGNVLAGQLDHRLEELARNLGAVYRLTFFAPEGSRSGRVKIKLRGAKGRLSYRRTWAGPAIDDAATPR